MRKLQNTKQSTKANTTISALQDAKNPSKQTPKNTLVVPRQVKVAIAVTTIAKPFKVGIQRFLCFSKTNPHLIQLKGSRLEKGGKKALQNFPYYFGCFLGAINWY
jgi:hypothetical protein